MSTRNIADLEEEAWVKLDNARRRKEDDKRVALRSLPGNSKYINLKKKCTKSIDGLKIVEKKSIRDAEGIFVTNRKATRMIESLKRKRNELRNFYLANPGCFAN
jgi:hypothetical protein